MNRHLHIVCPDAPWPADNSIAIDIYYKIEALRQQGVKIHLHYFCDKPHCNPNELNRHCETIHPYSSGKQKKENFFSPREAGMLSLVETLKMDNHPVLLAGITCPKIITGVSKMKRRIIIRLYKDECRHYGHLAKTTTSLVKKIFLKRRSQQMKKYEAALPDNCLYAFSTAGDATSFQQDHPLKNVCHLPVSCPFQAVTSETGIGNFCLYHGDLSDPDNERAATWLLSTVFNDIPTPLVIAGKEPGQRIKKLTGFYANTCLVANPTQNEIEDLIRKAHINVLPSFGNKRPELKLLHTLRRGKHCIVNENAVSDSPLKDACHIGANANAFKSIILQLYHQPFEQMEIDLRKRLLPAGHKEQSIHFLIEKLFGETP